MSGRYLEEKPILDHRTIDEAALNRMAERCAERPTIPPSGSLYQSSQGRLTLPDSPDTFTGTTTYEGPTTFNGPVTEAGPVYQTEYTTNALSGPTNDLDLTADWAPVLNVPTAGTTPVVLTGLVPPSLTTATTVTIRVPATSTVPLVLTSQDDGSTATSRFALPGDVAQIIAPGGKLTIGWNPTTQRWEPPGGVAPPVLPAFPTKPTAAVATTTTLPSYTYANGPTAVPGAGATITFTATGTQTIDGVLTTTGMRVLVTGETGGNAPVNGLFLVTVAGAPGVNGVWTRDPSMDVAGTWKGATVGVAQGTLNGGKTYYFPAATEPAVGTTAISFSQTQAAVPAGTAANALTDPAGTTTAAYAAVFDVTNASGLHGVFSIKNSGGVNSLDVRVTQTDFYGNSATPSATVTAGNYYVFDLHDFIGSFPPAPPYRAIKVEVKDTAAGSHTTWVAFLSLIG